MKRKVLCVVGTRPEAIKMAPVILALRQTDWAEVKVLATAQHRQLLDQVLRLFDIDPDRDLDIMRPNQALTTLTARLLLDIDEVLIAEKPHAVLVQGDTTTAMTAGLASFYHKIPLGHVEAGLRTGDMMNPFPEEMNRVVVSKFARWHFAPTESSRTNLLAEGIADPSIFVTGNTVIDALLNISARDLPLGVDLVGAKRMVLVTAHRRENFGIPYLNICKAVRALADANCDVEFLYPVHPNPNVREVAHRELGGHPRITLCEPLDYAPFVEAMKHAYLILTDSGGVQEEAPALGKPVLVMRNETERPEAIAAGVVQLVGTSQERIVTVTQELLDNPNTYAAMARGVSPYGDGNAATRIVDVLHRTLVL